MGLRRIHASIAMQVPRRLHVWSTACALLVIIYFINGSSSFKSLHRKDKTPYFTPTTQRIEINEAIPIGTRFYQMRAVGLSLDSQNSLSYKIIGVTAVDKTGVPVPLHDTRMPVIHQFFAIERITGELVVHSKVNRDVAAEVSLNISVADVSPSLPVPQVSFDNLIITITDFNDNPPTFGAPWTPEKPEISVSIMEEQPVGTVLINLLATDVDSDISHYEIRPPSPFFEISRETGVITIKRVIDYEALVKHSPLELDLRTPKLPNQLRVNVLAFDSGVPQLSAMAVVHVTVLNINDNEPVFNQTAYHTSIHENPAPGTFVAQVKATDGDLGRFGKITYSILSVSGDAGNNEFTGIKDYFVISNDTGVIRVGPNAKIDREAGPRKLTIQVGASDESPEDSGSGKRRTISVPFYVTVQDVNDNSPKFTQREYQATTVGHADGTSTNVPVIQVHANDGDEGIFGLVSYSILSGNINEVFNMDSKTGLISVSKPPADVNPEVLEYRLQVESRDEQGLGPFSDRATVVISIIRVNRHKPKFLFPSQPSIGFYENQKIGSKVVRVQAFDEDSGNNGVVKFSFKVNGAENVQETEEFSIDPESGLIVSKKVLDREERDRYDLVLVAQDYLAQPQSFETLQQLSILIKDVDDNKPEFSRIIRYVFAIAENEPRGTLIGKVSASDKDFEDENRRIFYHIIDGNIDNRFFLEKTTGNLYANTSFDREEIESYELVIKAAPKENLTQDSHFDEDMKKANIKDRSYNSDDLSLAFVVVKIKDVNDNKPSFSKPIFRTTVSFKADIGSTVTRVAGNDPDFGVNSSLAYSIRSIDLYRKGYDLPDSPVRPIPSPFAFSDASGEDGEIKCLQLVSQYPIGSRFVLAVDATEKSPPFRSTSAKVHLWIHDPSKLIKITVKLKPEFVYQQKDHLEDVLSSVTEYRVIITEIKYHYNYLENRVMKDWSDLYTFVIDDRTYSEVAPQRVIAKLDSSQKLHRERPIQIEQISLASSPSSANTLAVTQDMDSTSILFFSLVGLICIGFVTMGIAFCCLKSWYHQKLIEDARKAAAKARAMSIKERESRESILRMSHINRLNGDEDGASLVTAVDNPNNGSNKSNNSYEKRQQTTRSPTV